MSNRVEVTLEPGLTSLLDAEQPVPDAVLEPAVDAFLSTPGVAETSVHETLNETMTASAQATGEAFGWWSALKRWWNGEEQSVVGTERQPIAVASYWLTLPDVPDATVKVTSTVAQSTETSASLTIVGIGGGPTVKAELKDSVEFTATEIERAVLTRIGTFEKVEVRRGGAVVAQYPRLVAIDETVVDWARARDTVPDPATLGTPVDTATFRFTDASDVSTKTLTVSRGTSWELGLDLKLAQLGLEFKGGVKITYDRDVEYECTLPAGHDYAARSYSSFPAYVWTVGALPGSS
jgi:hypothetical protein